MEGTGSTSLSEALLQWVKSFDRLGTIEGWNDLSDGNGLWRILQDVDSGYFSGSLPEPDVGPSGEWTRKWQNIKHLERQLSTYYRDVCNGQDNTTAAAAPDLQAIAASGSVGDLEKLIMVIIRAAMASPESNQRTAQRLMSLGRERAVVIANELRNMEEPEYGESEPASRDESAYQSEQETKDEARQNGTKNALASYRDPLLEREEELLQAQATIDKLQASQAAAQRQLQELRQDKERLQEAFDAYRAEIDTKGRKPGGEDAFKKLQRQAENDRAYIEDLENQMQASRSTMESYERQLERYKAESEAGQKLRDDLQMLRAENEDLSQKVKANENLKKKIQTLQEQEKANASLREELKQANERLEELDRLRHVQAGLEKEIIEKKGLIRNQEYQINELTTTRKHAEYDARVLAQKLEAARERHDRDHEALEELRLKLQDARIEEPEIDEAPQEREKQLDDGEQERKPAALKNDESKHHLEKIALLEQQLTAADARLKQANERIAAQEEQNLSKQIEEDARQKAELQVSEYEKTIAELRQQVEAGRQQEPVPQDIASLQRENRLITTAWYDLSSRLQNNGVSLGRRRPEPRSWIGKQRALVGPNNSLVSLGHNHNVPAEADILIILQQR
jgi:protein HOOK3